MVYGFTEVSEFMPDKTEHNRRIAKRLREVSQGKTNNTEKNIVFTTGATTTTVTLAPGRIGSDTVFVLVPVDANAAAEWGTAAPYVSSRDVLNNTFTITHQNAGTTRTVDCILIG